MFRRGSMFFIGTVLKKLWIRGNRHFFLLRVQLNTRSGMKLNYKLRYQTKPYCTMHRR